MCIGKYYRDNPVEILIVYIFFTLLICMAFVGGTFIPILWIKILVLVILSILFVLAFLLLRYIYTNSKQREDTLYYNELNEEFIIHYHNKDIKIKKEDIVRIVNHNLHIDYASILKRDDYGKIKFYLRNGKSYKTPTLENIYNVYFKIDEIVFNDNNRPLDKFYEMDTRWSKWGAKKEYPGILSLIVAVVLPLIGLTFVENQAKLKEFKYGKNNGLTILSFTISILWWLIVIILIGIL